MFPKIIFITLLALSCLSCKDRYSKMEAAIESGNTAKLEKFLKKEAPSQKQYVRLMNLALKKQSSFIMPMLIAENGFPLNDYRIKTDAANLTLLALAINRHEFEAAKKLVDLGADMFVPVNNKEDEFVCPLYLAMDTYSDDLFSYMVDSALQKKSMPEEDFYALVLKGFEKHIVTQGMLKDVLHKDSFPFTEENCKQVSKVVIKKVLGKSFGKEWLKLIFENKNFILDCDSVSNILQAIYIAEDKDSLEYFLTFKDLYAKVLESANTPFILIRDSRRTFGAELAERLKNEKLTFGQKEPYLPYAIDFGHYDIIPWLLKNGVSPFAITDYNGRDMNAFDTVDWKEKLGRMAMSMDNDEEWLKDEMEKTAKLQEVRKMLLECK